MTGTYESYADYQLTLRLMYLLERNPGVIERLIIAVDPTTYWTCADAAFDVEWQAGADRIDLYNRTLAKELAGAFPKDDLAALLDMAEAQVAMEGT